MSDFNLLHLLLSKIDNTLEYPQVFINCTYILPHRGPPQSTFSQNDISQEGRGS